MSDCCFPDPQKAFGEMTGASVSVRQRPSVGLFRGPFVAEGVDPVVRRGFRGVLALGGPAAEQAPQSGEE